MARRCEACGLGILGEIGDADWVLIDRTRPNVIDRLDPVGFDMALERLTSSGEFELVLNRDGVLLFRRTGAVGP